MADEQQPNAEGQPAQDAIKNVKSEFERKLANVDAQINELNRTNQALLAQITASQAVKQQQPADDISKLWYDNPQAAAAAIQAQTEKAIEAKYAAQQQAQAKTNQVLNQLVYDYPELASDNSELTKKTLQKYMALDNSEKQSPSAYKWAVKEAAEELNVKPRAKRENFDDSFAASGSSSGSSRPSKSSKSKLAPETVAFAKLVGMNTDDPKVIERLEKRQRDNWTKYR